MIPKKRKLKKEYNSYVSECSTKGIAAASYDAWIDLLSDDQVTSVSGQEYPRDIECVVGA